MRKNIFLCLVLLFLSTFLQAQTEIKQTSVNLNLRDTPSESSNIALVIPKGTVLQIDLSNQKYSDWTLVKYNNQIGYVKSNYLVTSTNSSSVKYYTNSKGNKVQSPTYYKTVPEGATAECNDGTYSFSQSRRGTCSHHGGVKRWIN